MIVADTSIWIEFLKGNPEYLVLFAERIESGEILGLSIIFGELLQGVKNEREEKIIIAFWDSIPKIDEQDLFIEAGLLSQRHKFFSKGIGLIDATLIVAAQKAKAKVWTLDKKLKHALPPDMVFGV